MRAEDPDDPVADSVELQREAAALGFDWNHVEELWAKLDEEIGELREAVGLTRECLNGTPALGPDRTQGEARVLDEFGDLLFVAINLSRHLKVDPTRALAHANAKFRRRFEVVMAGRPGWDQLQGPARVQEMERLWQQAKREGR